MGEKRPFFALPKVKRYGCGGATFIARSKRRTTAGKATQPIGWIPISRIRGAHSLTRHRSNLTITGRFEPKTRAEAHPLAQPLADRHRLPMNRAPGVLSVRVISGPDPRSSGSAFTGHTEAGRSHLELDECQSGPVFRRLRRETAPRRSTPRRFANYRITGTHDDLINAHLKLDRRHDGLSIIGWRGGTSCLARDGGSHEYGPSQAGGETLGERIHGRSGACLVCAGPRKR